MKAAGGNRPLSHFCAARATMALDVPPFYALRLILSSRGRAMSLKSKWESAKGPIRDILTIAGLGRLTSGLWPWIGGGLTVFVSWFADEPLVTIWVYGLVALVALVWARNGLHWWKVQHGTTSIQSQTNTQDRSSDAEEIKCLVGSWTVRKRTLSEPRYLAVWDFSEDDTVVSDREGDHATGTWRIEPTRVVIQWDRPLRTGEQCYDTFHRPINPVGVQGDSWGGWDGLNKVRATKTPATG